jgi:chromosome partitioning protein
VRRERLATRHCRQCHPCRQAGTTSTPQGRQNGLANILPGVLLRQGRTNMNIIAIANQKGGTAKTTTVAALGLLLSRQGTRVHMVDLDPQASLTHAFGHTDSHARSANPLLKGDGLVTVTVAENLTLSPSAFQLSQVETDLLAEDGREHRLRTCLARTPLPPDIVILLDSPPSLGILAVNCLTVANGLIAVVQPGGFELHALMQLHITMESIRHRVNPDLRVLGAVVTNAHRRRRITGQVERETAGLYSILGTVRSDARLLTASSTGRFHRLSRSAALDDYAQVLRRLRTVLA